jgi:preprotein translocase subunit SecE
MNNLLTYFKESFYELQHNVTWTSWEELQESLILVVTATFIFAIIIFAIDQIFSNVIKLLYEVIV